MLLSNLTAAALYRAPLMRDDCSQRRRRVGVALVAALAVVIAGCEGGAGTAATSGAAASTGSGASTTAQALSAADLFDTETVKTLRIRMSAETYAAMQDDVQALVGSSSGPGGAGGGPRGAGGGPGGGGPGVDGAAMQAACTGKATGTDCAFTTSTGESVTGSCAQMGPGFVCLPAGGPPAGGGGPGGGGGGGLDLLSADPIWVDVDMDFEGIALAHVGMRYKGNSSLTQSVQQGLRKLPFRLDFDRYEDAFPATKNQRLAGFGKMTFSSNFGDDAQVREALAVRLLADFGLPAARATFVRVYVDTGAGETYWGLYTMIEDPADKAFRDHRFGSHDGNTYKPDGATANWASFAAADFEKKNNEDAADFSDVQGAVEALHADRSDAAAWRAGLQTRLDVDGFLRWLAANTAITNWDAYGQMAHNYYLYADPAAMGQLAWIPWDHNFGFVTSGAAGPGAQSKLTSSDPATAMLHTTVGDQWPLIAWLLADPVYNARYRELLAAFVAGPGAPSNASAIARAMHERIASAVAAEESGSTTVSSQAAFSAAIDGDSGLAAFFVSQAAKAAAALGQ